MSAEIPRLLFAAPASGSGKTMVTCGFLKLCQRRGLNCRTFKCGPDYIDPMFHNYVSGISGSNLDSFFLPEKDIRTLFAQRAKGADIAVIEGVMGYYDGVAGLSTQASSYDIARITDTPVVLVVDGKKGSLSLAALIKGFCEFRSDSGIRGVILNRTGRMMAERLRPQIEALNLHLAGWIPECEEAALESRHLGLTLPGEQLLLREKLERLANRIAEGLDLDWLLQTAQAAGSCWEATGAGRALAGTQPEPGARENHGRAAETGLIGRSGGRYRIAAAMDEAFCFYYQENLTLLQEAGAVLAPFSPLHDSCLPENCDAVLLGGGYPELYARDLSANREMCRAIKAAHEAGIKIIAECGGFLYLHDTLEDADGLVYPMAGVIAGHGYRTGRLSRFGYVTLTDGKRSIRGHEFHYWDSDNCGARYQAVKPLSERSWSCMHETDTLLAGFPHLYYPSGRELILRFLEKREELA